MEEVISEKKDLVAGSSGSYGGRNSGGGLPSSAGHFLDTS